MFVTIAYFEDMYDEHHPYSPGDTYPRNGVSTTAKRLAELSTGNNARGIPLIKQVADPVIKQVADPMPKQAKKRRKKNADDSL